MQFSVHVSSTTAVLVVVASVMLGSVYWVLQPNQMAALGMYFGIFVKMS